MILPRDIEAQDFTRDKRGYNSREVDEFLDLICQDYGKVLEDNRSMAHKIKFLEKQLEEATKSDSAMLETLETAKRLMGDISASAERRAELMMRDAELEAENMMLEARASVRKLNEEHLLLSNKVNKLRRNLKSLLESELAALENDDADLLSATDRSDIPEIEKEFAAITPAASDQVGRGTLVVKDDSDDAQAEEAAAPEAPAAPLDPNKATVADLSESLRKMAEGNDTIDDTIILK